MRAETIYCTKHPAVAMVPMRNAKKAPTLGCPECHPQHDPTQEPPAPAPAPQPEPTHEPAPAPRRSLTLLGLLRNR